MVEQEPVNRIPTISKENAEKIKNTMKTINMNPPKWAQKYVYYIKHFNHSLT